MISIPVAYKLRTMLNVKLSVFLILLVINFLHREPLAASESPGEQQAVLRVASDIDYAPLSSVNNGQISGLDIDLVYLLDRNTELHYEHYLDTWSRVLQGLEHGHFDIVTGILATPERRERFDFTIPYIVDRYAIFIRNDSPIRSSIDLPGFRAAVLDQDAVIENYLVPYDLHEGIIRTDTFTESLMLVHEGIADYTIAPLSLGIQLSSELDLELQYTGRELFSVDYRLAVRKGEQDLLEILNDSILDMHLSGSLEQLRRKWDFYTPLSVSSPDPTSPLGALIVVSVCLLISAMFIIIRLMIKLKKQHENRQVRVNEYLSALLDTVPLPVWWKNCSLQYEGCNRAFLEQMNISSITDIKGRTDEDFFAGREANFRTTEDRLVLEQGLSSSYQEEQGIFRSVLKNSSGEIIGLLACSGQDAATAKLQAIVRNLTNQLAEKESELKQLSLLDNATGLFRAEFVDMRLHEEIEMFKRYGQRFTLVFIDIFPEPAEYSSETCRRASGLIKRNIRQVDVPGISADNFIYILLPRTSVAEAGEIGYKLKKLLLKELGLYSIRVSVSEYSGEDESEFLSAAVRKILHNDSRSLV